MTPEQLPAWRPKHNTQSVCAAQVRARPRAGGALESGRPRGIDCSARAAWDYFSTQTTSKSAFS